MRITISTLLCYLLPLTAWGAAIELDPVNPPSIELVYDASLTGNTDFCAATPHDLFMTIDCSSGCSGQFTLEGSGGVIAPVSLVLSHDWDSEPDMTLIPGQETGELPSQGNDCGNHRNRRTITATVNKNDINPVKIPYERNIQVQLRNNKGDTETGSFYIRIGSPDMIRISGLEDLPLTPQANWQKANEQVCVFSTTGHYNLTAISANNGELKNAGNSIPYALQYKEHNTAIWKDLTLGQSFPNITASGTELCNDGVYIGIQAKVTESDMNSAPTGNYSDTVTLTVEAT